MPPRRDLRFKVQVCKGDTPMAQFQSLEMGDLWEDANLLECLVYAWTSKHLRLGLGWCQSRVRIPPEWHEVMTDFMEKYQAEVFCCLGIPAS